MRGGWGRKAALCGIPRFLRLAAFLAAFGPLATLAGRGAGACGACRALQHAAFLAAFGPLATLAGWGALGREGHAALCGLPRFLRPSGRSQRLRGWGALGREGHAALCSMPRFLRPLGRSQRLRGWGAGAWGACRALHPGAFLAAFGPLATLAFLCCGTGIWGAAPNPGRGMIPLHPTLSPLLPYLTTLLLSLRISSVTPSGGSPNVALSVLLPPSHVSCIAISLASIRQPSSTTVTTSPTS